MAIAVPAATSCLLPSHTSISWLLGMVLSTLPVIAKLNGFSLRSLLPKEISPLYSPAVSASNRTVKLAVSLALTIAGKSTTLKPSGLEGAISVRSISPILLIVKILGTDLPTRVAPKSIGVVVPSTISLVPSIT